MALYLVIPPNDRLLLTIKVLKEFLRVDLRTAKDVADRHYCVLDDSQSLPVMEKLWLAHKIDYYLLDGPPKRVEGCCICDTPKVTHWMSYDLFLDPEQAEKCGGQPFCTRCWASVPFERFLSIMEPSTAWERLGGVWDE